MDFHGKFSFEHYGNQTNFFVFLCIISTVMLLLLFLLFYHVIIIFYASPFCYRTDYEGFIFFSFLLLRIQLPLWVLEAMEKNEMHFEDKYGIKNKEYISFGCEDLHLLHGRTPMEAFRDLMSSFKENLKMLFQTTVMIKCNSTLIRFHVSYLFQCICDILWGNCITYFMVYY